MDAKELMIGDWYQWYADGKYYQYQVKAEDFTKDYVANFEPIPLTPEILKKNEFEHIPLKKRWILECELELIEDKLGDTDLEYWFSVSDQYVCPIHYVHELQHALRLCGLKDLADNFKVD